jgi:hypothetical protein
MKKTIIFSCLALFLYAQDDYVPLSKLSNAKKIEYNFVDKKEKVEKPKIGEYEPRKIQEKEYEAITPIKKVEIKENIIENDVNIEKIEEPKEEEKVINKEFVKEYKNDNILQNVKKNSLNSSKDFEIAPKLSYSFLKTDIYITDKVSIVEEKGIVIPEISFSYKEHTLKAETMSVKSYFEGVIIGGEDLAMKNSWHKLSYLYKYQNANIGLAYNSYEMKGDFIFDNVYYYANDKQRFPSLELHLKNEEDRIQAEYGLSYGKNSDIDYAYEYYVNLGYKIFKNNDLVINAGYKNKTIEIEEARYQHKGPIISLGGTF